jgi:hypothetical protein
MSMRPKFRQFSKATWVNRNGRVVCCSISQVAADHDYRRALPFSFITFFPVAGGGAAKWMQRINSNL